MDDIVITSPSLHVINSLKNFLHTQFKLKDFGGLKYFFGLEIACSSTSIIFSQRHYNLQVLEDTGFLATKPTTFPMDPKLQLHVSTRELFPNPSMYRRLIGHLIY